MGRDAHVNCDCFERGRVKTPPRPEWEVYVAEDGSRATPASSFATVPAFDDWSATACEHPNGIAIYHRIGSGGTVACIRRILQQRALDFPLILSKVVCFEGFASGNMLSVDEAKAMKPEVDCLAVVHPADPDDGEVLSIFESQMRELVECSLRLNRPIVF